jgi:hypothetical protein
MATQRIKQEVLAKRAGILFAHPSTVEAASMVAVIAPVIVSVIVAVIAPRDGTSPCASIPATNVAIQRIGVAAIYNSSASAYHRRSAARIPMKLKSRHRDPAETRDIDRATPKPEDKRSIAICPIAKNSSTDSADKRRWTRIAFHL